jgi:NAD(P)-dependent dehydrogenase (short-subunit alcohol dehydrogenase family)
MAGSSTSTPPFQGKVALVTGAGRGIGRATAIGVAEAGATIGLLARSVDELEEVEKVVTGLGGTALVSPADVGDGRQLAAVAAKLTSKAGLEAHTKNLAAELAGTGVTVNGYRPGGVDTAMQAWVRNQPADEIGAALHQRFQNSYESGSLITPEHSARSLVTHLTGDDNGEIWSVDGV